MLIMNDNGNDLNRCIYIYIYIGYVTLGPHPTLIGNTNLK